MKLKNKMKPWNINRVEQVGPTCTIACAAMILGVAFEVVEKHFHPENVRTLTTLSDYLGDHGYAVLIKESLYHTHPRFGFTEDVQTFCSGPCFALKAVYRLRGSARGCNGSER